MAKKKRVIISSERSAIYTKYKRTPEQIQKYEDELSAPDERFAQLVEMWDRQWLEAKQEFGPSGEFAWKKGESREAIGNKILERAFSGDEIRMAAMLARVQARQKYNQQFFETFKVPLRDYWEGNHLGLDVIRLDEIVKPREDQSTAEAIREKWGEAAVTMVMELVSGIKEKADVDQIKRC